MAQLLSFPGLGISLALNRIAFHMPSFLGGWPVYWYGIILAVAFLTASVYIMRKVKLFGLDNDRAFDVLLVSIVGAIIGARLYYVAFSWDEYNSILDIISTRNGGLALYGGLIGGVLTGALMCKIRKVKLLPMLDISACAIILGQAVGRWANLINIEAFGSNTDLPWGMTSPVITNYLMYYKDQLTAIGMNIDPNQPVHPTFFYESMWCLLGFALLLFLTKRRRFDGQLSLVYLMWYGAGRFSIEGLRTDSLLMGNMRVSQLLALVCVLVAGVTLVIVLSRIRRESDPEYLKLYVNTDEGKAVLAGEFYKKKDMPAKSEAEADAVEEGALAEESSEADKTDEESAEEEAAEAVEEGASAEESSEANKTDEESAEEEAAEAVEAEENTAEDSSKSEGE